MDTTAFMPSTLFRFNWKETVFGTSLELINMMHDQQFLGIL